MKGIFARQEVTILKHDGCSTNFISKDFVAKSVHLLNIQDAKMIISQSVKNIAGTCNQMIKNGVPEIRAQTYISN